jgi:hypothetical protein
VRHTPVGDVPIIVDISARFLFPSKTEAAKVATWMRRRHDARVKMTPAGFHRSLRWRLDARIPQTRFDLERLRLLANGLAEEAEAGHGVLVDWEAVRPGLETIPSRIRRRIRRRATVIVGADVAVAAAGVTLKAFTVLTAAAVAVVVEAALWLALGRLTPRR